MNGLKQVTLIKSAKFDFARVNVDGNSLFIGANGAGKTTLLRAILYFYTASSNGLGISSSKKISFSDYYFEYENSYIIYIYKKDDKYILVTTYKDGTVKFRFALFNTMPDVKDIFIKDNQPIEIASLWLKLKELAICSNIIQNGTKYKEILYSKSNKDKIFSLFEAKSYESFTKTLSNIFINSKVDSEAIKKVIVSSLDINSSIDLSQVHRYLSRFNTIYEDIKSYELNNSNIKKIIELLNEYEQTKGLLQDDIGTLANSKEQTKILLEGLDAKIQKLEENKDDLSQKLTYEQNLYQKRKDKQNQSKGLVSGFIKDINIKKEHYEKQNIEDKISLFDTLILKKEELKSILNKKDFLTKEYENLQQHNELQIQSINNSFVSLKNEFEQKVFEQKSKQDKEIEILKIKESKDIENINENYLKSSLEINEQKIKITSQIQEERFDLKHKTTENFTYKNEHQITEYQNQQISIKNRIDKNTQNINLLDKDISNYQATFNHQESTLTKNYTKEHRQLTNKIENINKLLNPTKDTFIDKVYKHSKNSEKYIHFLKDEILQSDIDIEFNNDTNSIFEFEIKNINLQKGKLELTLENLNNELVKLEKDYRNDKDSLEKILKSSEAKIYKEKKELNENIKIVQIEQITVQTKLTNLIENRLKDEDIFKKDKILQIEDINNKIELLDKTLLSIKDKQNNLLKIKENDIKSKKSNFTKLIKKAQQQYEPSISNFTNEIINQEIQKNIKLKEQDTLYHNLLKQNGVDTKKLKELNIKESKLQDSIIAIQKYQVIIIEYKKDKIEFIDKLDIKNQELKNIKNELIQLNTEFEFISKDFEDKQKDLEDQLKEKKEEQSKKNYEIQRVNEFENTTTFHECLKWNIKYIKNENSDDLLTLIQRIDNTASKYRDYYSKVQNILGRLNCLFDTSLHITREIDALETAYNLKEYHETKKIENAKSLLSQNLNQILKSIIEQYDKLLESQGKIESLIKKITKIFEEIKIGVIDTLALRYLKTNNKIIETFSAIKEQNEQNSLSYFSDSLFSDIDNSKVVIELLKKLIDLIEFEKTLHLDIEDSFILEFRVVENGNDSKYVPSLDMVGSNGTDVLVKSMIYVAMLYIFKQQLTKKDLSFHVVLDEVGILSQRYLKELIEFANKKAIVFVNGAPDEKLIGTYKQVSLISKVNKISVVKELIVK